MAISKTKVMNLFRLVNLVLKVIYLNSWILMRDAYPGVVLGDYIFKLMYLNEGCLPN